MIKIPRRLTAALLAAVFACSAASAQDSVPTPAPAGATFSLEQCIARALQRNFNMEIGRYGPEIAQEAIEVSHGGHEPELSVTGSNGVNTSPGLESKSSDLRVGISQKFYSGTTVSASSRLNRSSSDPALSTLNPAYDADLTVSVRQSLLQGLDRSVNHASVERAEIGLQRAKLDYKATALDVIQDTENAYYILAAAREQLVVRNFSFALAQRLFDEARIRRDTGVATNLDVLTAEVGVANARRNVILAGRTPCSPSSVSSSWMKPSARSAWRSYLRPCPFLPRPTRWRSKTNPTIFPPWPPSTSSSST
jgi:outer membrane protein